MCDDGKTGEIGDAKKSWENTTLKPEIEKKPECKKEFVTASGIPIRDLYTPLDLAEKGWGSPENTPLPGE